MHKASGQVTEIHHWVFEWNVKSTTGKWNGRSTKVTDVYAIDFEDAVATFRAKYPIDPFADDVQIVSVNKSGRNREVLTSRKVRA